jgi:hypothetical protein
MYANSPSVTTIDAPTPEGREPLPRGGACAALVPALRAGRVDPLAALGHD